MKAHTTWLAVVAVVNSAISLYYYIRIVVMMYIREPEHEGRVVPSRGQTVAIAACIIFTLVVGFYPQPVIALAKESILSLAPWVP